MRSFSSLTLVRHAMPEVDPKLDPEEWALSAAGLHDSRLSTVEVTPSTRIVASTERKAIVTTAIVTGQRVDDIATDRDFGEVRRNEPFDNDYLDRRGKWVGGKPDHRHADWETFQDVGCRVDAAMSRYAAESLVVGTHGMALTAWLVYVGLVQAGSSATKFWAELGFPELVEVEWESGAGLRLVRRL